MSVAPSPAAFDLRRRPLAAPGAARAARRTRALRVAALTATLVAGPLSAQLPPAGARAFGMGGHVTATARGPEAIAVNPAGLGLAPSTLVVALLPVRLDVGLDPVTLADLDEWEGRAVPRSIRERWFESILQDGGERGTVAGELTAVAASWRGWGVQLSTVAGGVLRLNPDAAELVLFGNAGRAGSTPDFDLEGSAVDGFVTTTAALAYGADAGPLGGGRLALGGTLKVTVGNGVILARDRGTLGTSDPLEIEVDFPVLSNPSSDDDWTHGAGVGVDLGAAWTRAGLRLGASVRNLFNTFQWTLDDLVFREGSGLVDEEDADTDFDERPSEQAPQALRAELLALDFGPEVAVGAGWSPRDALEVAADLAWRDDRGMAPGPDLRLGAGAIWRTSSFSEIRGHLSLAGEGVRFGGGLGLRAGPARLDLGWARRSWGPDDGTLLVAGFQLGGSCGFAQPPPWQRRNSSMRFPPIPPMFPSPTS